MGRIGLKAIIYFEIVTTIALFLGLAAVNLVRPGDGMKTAATAAEAAAARAQTSFDIDARAHVSRPASSTPWRAATCCRSWCSRSCSAPPARPSERRPGPS